ncbi:sulfur carrier protein ThiS [Rhodococcus sp. BP-349]|jgi:sulfur carrier protein|uniref:sulfur carrier protein ThiS n=1 Tax=unclassified Rhodococcus (in: high G+C Gram-positive bacteria) TaxID=192944 RepID=UPI0004896D7D|nr:MULTISPECIES: sulfur carrier protein ThiS [unclassified Rhodococcus (in: high G+C Gram-positive bacteria)]KQU36143.1 thiamine biosynthesis protein ThiS [Rhodococcus sp. Leaf225]KQU48691.1 thiamine biosynthesis protein ThiS [Rhodococcus sp. Leaf258]MBY6539516.1 sulfur carrier protein ThiS [Rhodococcus sp. BP-363]MBY6544156.1 sulfur carrier protein ThiS [Rhodococcus sp. BP-369]MBY6563386.1 sulfur carrier protein ThiS [Rhodococcus sp. BP-370]
MTAVGVTVNGADHDLEPGTTVQDMLTQLGLPEKGIAVAVDGIVLPRSRWGEDVGRGWTIEVLTAVQGG